MERFTIFLIFDIDTWAVTAAHCLDRYPAVTAVTFRAGSSDRLAGGQIFSVVEYVIHPAWDDIPDNNDVAVVQINGIFAGTNIGKVMLAP
jgi:Trypsin